MRPDLDAIRKRRAWITPPPYRVVCRWLDATETEIAEVGGWMLIVPRAMYDPEKQADYNANFFADAPSDIDALLDYVEELEQQWDALRVQLGDAKRQVLSIVSLVTEDRNV